MANNPIPVPVSPAAGKVEIDERHGVTTVIVRDLAHLRVGVNISDRLAFKQAADQ
jgi:hypothetical protein